MFQSFYKYVLVCLFIVASVLVLGCSDNDDSKAADALRVTEFYPQEGDYGTEVTILGAGFGNYRLDVSGHIYFNGTEATKILYYSDNRIVIKAPEGFTTGPITVRVQDKEVATTEIFNYVETEQVDEDALRVSDFTPKRGYYLTEVTITGANFGTSANTVKVSFNGVEAEKIVSVTETEIKAIVPAGATTGPITVNTGLEEVSSDEVFTYLEDGAEVQSVSPAHAWSGEEVTITGVNFHDVGAENITVDFKGGKATAISATDTEIKVIVPADAASGTFTVTFGDEQTFSGVVFQKYTLNQSDFTGAYGSSYEPFKFSTGWDPCYIRIDNNYLEFYFDQAACDADNRRERRGAEVVCDFSTWSEAWYGYKLFLPEGKFPKDVEGSIITQIFNGGDANTWAGHLVIDNKNLCVSYRGSAAASAEKRETVGELAWNQWIPVVLYYKAGKNNKAEIRVWMGDDMQENSPTLTLTDINLGFGYWLDDNTLNGEVTEDNRVADSLGGKWGLYVQAGGDRIIRFDNLSVLSGNPVRDQQGNLTTGFKIVDPRGW